jgi:hypothetical protein
MKFGGDKMTVTEILQSVKLVVDHNGKPTAALLDMDAWEAFVSNWVNELSTLDQG